MNKYDAIKEEIQELVVKGNEIWKALSRYGDDNDRECFRFFHQEYEKWYSKAHSIVKQILPDRLKDFIELYKRDNRKTLSAETYCINDALRDLSVAYSFEPSDASELVLQQVTILDSCLERFDSKVYDINSLVQADLFDSEIESAEHLKDKGFLRAAGAICGVVIEKHLSKLINDRSLMLKKRNPSIADYNDILKDSAYGTVEWRKIQHLGDIRNLCDHNKEREPMKSEIEELISGTKWLIKTVF